MRTEACHFPCTRSLQERLLGPSVRAHEGNTRTANPRLPVEQALPDVLHAQGLASRGELVVLLQPPDDDRALGLGQETRVVWEVLHDPKRDRAGKDSRKSFDD